MTRLGWIGRFGIIAGLCLLVIANVVILKNKTPEATLKVLPLFHVAMVLYAVGTGGRGVFSNDIWRFPKNSDGLTRKTPVGVLQLAPNIVQAFKCFLQK